MKTSRCSVDQCELLVHGRGLCMKHYLQMRRGKLSSAGATRQELVLEFIEMCVVSTSAECLIPTFQPNVEYPRVNLGSGDVRIGWVVLTRTVGPRPHRNHVMRHLCGNRRCCNPNHLAWGTQKENAADRKIHGTEPDRKGSKNGRAYLTEKQVSEIKRLYQPYLSCRQPSNQRDLARRFKVPVGVIRRIVYGQTWKHNRA